MEEKIIKFFGVIDKEVEEIDYGTITVNVVLNDGLPVFETANLVKSKRIKYKVDKNNKS